MNYPFKTSPQKKQGTFMKNSGILIPLFKKIDKILFGIEEINEIDKQPESIESDNDEEFDVQRSIN
ncbi:hypothetical protein [Legionella antarctica]|nr:hypothetical protein [Legionella antarctica]